jgi:hypothetical protein
VDPPRDRAGLRELRRVRLCLGVVIAGLVLSGLTAFALETELAWLVSILGAPPGPGPDPVEAGRSGILPWLVTVRDALVETSARHPFLSYGTDWLGFAHLVIAVAFLGALRDPLRHAGVVDFGLVACAGVILFPWIAGPFRGIPIPWRLVDASFGLACAIPLLAARRDLRRLGVM